LSALSASPAAEASSPVPEPTSIVLGAVALALMLLKYLTRFRGI
jgi:hypothetical protein